ncbi:MAG: peptide chain release factor-like protein [Bdellovibrionales bacterium]|nr:peptide chain release factor-like protein [Bdellovibrionales bacterium]
MMNMLSNNKFGVSLAKERQLAKLMEKLGVKESDLIEKFIRGSGKGGQKINKTASCVYLKHKPTGIEVKCQQERSRALNRFFARRELCLKIDAKLNKEHSIEIQKKEKIRRQKSKRSKRAKAKMLDDKRKRSEVKDSRKKPAE